MNTTIMKCAPGIFTILLFTASCNEVSTQSETTAAAAYETDTSLAIYEERTSRATGNKLMGNGVNRRIFNIKTKQSGKAITCDNNGRIFLEPGTYRISGFSTVTMEITMPNPYKEYDYPGYCMVYPTKYESLGREELQLYLWGVGGVASSDKCSPSCFDMVYTITKNDTISVGHQSGANYKYPIYLSVYKTLEGDSSDYRVFSRIAIQRLMKPKS